MFSDQRFEEECHECCPKAPAQQKEGRLYINHADWDEFSAGSGARWLFCVEAIVFARLQAVLEEAKQSGMEVWNEFFTDWTVAVLGDAFRIQLDPIEMKIMPYSPSK